ncbi:hypothetical protein BN946_scf184978.g5 [Trametes cinnabarina]|uniref:Enoyl reductase (ER) domain-containing protein n=1 Tax=Pycnoporus cinnabarinus TaxID=5643 RepID=A0A060SRJ5_PYCCI|nr:hypothetical protein BN946_scf184978.g5 [Trametes cinnabarina]
MLSVCGSDLHSWHAIIPGVSPTSTEPNPVTNETLPVTMGHEFSGTVTDIGPGVDASRFKPGTKVAVEPLLSCMKPTCPFCSSGARNLCRNATFMGIGGRGGGLSEYVCVPQEQVFPLPSHVPLDVGAIVEPLSVAWHAVKRSNLKAGDKVLILGGGPIGLLTLRVVKAWGAKWIALSEPASKRRELALQHGASVVFDPTAPGTDIVAEVIRETDGWGADVVYDCAGLQQTLDTAFKAVKPRGHVMNVAIWEGRPLLDISSMTLKEFYMSSVLAYDRVHPEVVEAVGQGKFDGLETLITRRISFEDFVEKGIKALLHEKDQHGSTLDFYLAVPALAREESGSLPEDSESRGKSASHDALGKLEAPPAICCLVFRWPLLAICMMVLALIWGSSGKVPQSPTAAGFVKFPDLYEASIAELQNGLEQGHFSSVDLVKAYFARIEEVNLQGPALRAVIEINPSALKQAAELDLERRILGPRGPLHGIPILLKDNIATLHSDGSFALLGSVVPRDAHVAAKLRAAGAILLGKANLSEWAHFRGNVPSGFSGRGGQATSAYVPQGDPSGSSSGSGIGTSIGLAAAALGTETDGSIISPSNMNNLVGIKPTVGLTSRAGVIPISVHQDTVGPMARSVADAAAVLAVIAGRDPRDNFTFAQPLIVPDYTKALKPDGLKGVRLGVPRKFLTRVNSNILSTFNASLDIIRSLGATIIDPADFPDFAELEASRNETIVTQTDFKVDINQYISELLEVPTGVKNLADLIAFNIAHADEELVPPFWTDQSIFIESENTTVNQAYFNAIAADKDLGATRGIDATLKAFKLDALLMPSAVAPGPAAIAGYPIITGKFLPLGFLPPNTPLSPAQPTRSSGPNQPFGIAFMGTAFSEFELISFAFAYEQATHNRLKVLAFPEAIPKTQLADVVGK